MSRGGPLSRCFLWSRWPYGTLKYNNLISHLGQWFSKWGPETSRGPAEGLAGGQSMHIMWHNLISLSFISQRSTHREDMRIIGFMFRFTHHAEQEMQNKHASVGNVWANLWISGRPQIWKILVKNGRPSVCNPAENTKRFADLTRASPLWLHVWSCPSSVNGPRPGCHSRLRNLDGALVEAQFGRGDIEWPIFHQRPHQPNYSPVWGAENINFVKWYAELPPAAISAPSPAVFVLIVFALK